MESFLLIVCLLISFSGLVLSRGAGRAFPVASENFVIDNFQEINPSIDWDETNFLIDLSGHYAICESLRKPLGLTNVDRRTKDGANIGGFVDSIEGSETHVDAVTNYIAELVRRWKSNQQYNELIRSSGRFGCSVRPGCTGYAVVACLFSSTQLRAPPTLNRLPTTTISTTRSTSPETAPASTVLPTTYPAVAPERLLRTQRPLFGGEVRALAFTEEQYKLAEGFINDAWDPSHYLENLSGYETDCAMIGSANWDFHHTELFKKENPYNIKGIYGYALNRGSTPAALGEILPGFKDTIHTSNVKDLGCSLIPDCVSDNGSMYVVVSCLYEF